MRRHYLASITIITVLSFAVAAPAFAQTEQVQFAANVEFIKGTIEAIPLPDASVDVIISNCVINLSADKDAVLRESFRVLTPGATRSTR